MIHVRRLEMFWFLAASALIVGCYGNIISLEGSEGEFESSNYPAPSRDNDTTWHITVPPGQGIKLSFIDLTMDWCSDYICLDCTVLEVMEVKENSSSELSTFCSASSDYPAPKPIISTTRRVHVTLHVPLGDKNRDKAKFKARYQAVLGTSGVLSTSDLLLVILSITGLLVIILIASLACFFCRHRRPGSFTKRTIAGRAFIGIKERPYLGEAPKEPRQGQFLPVYTVLPGPPIYVTDKSSCVTVDETTADHVENTEQKP